MSAYEDVKCPDCDGPMVSRANKTTGQRFWGCKDYPKCHGTRNTDGEAKHDEERSALPSDRMRGNDTRRWRQS